MSHINLLHQLDRRVIALENCVSALVSGTLNPESLKELRQTMAVARVVLKEWRDKQGYDGEPPGRPADSVDWLDVLEGALPPTRGRPFRY
jgi:hypothetical protein